MQVLGTTSYCFEDQKEFAALSGDFNPLHLNDVIARREFFGDVVVHGIHCLLDVLDAYFKTIPSSDLESFALQTMSVKFQGPIYLDKKIKIVLVKKKDLSVKLIAIQDLQNVLEVTLDGVNGSLNTDIPFPIKNPNNWITSPSDYDLDELENHEGICPLYLQKERAMERFPYASKVHLQYPLAVCLALTRLVGMECPGLRSIFSAFKLTFRQLPNPDSAFSFKVVVADARVSLVKMDVSNNEISGEIQTFYRPHPQQQPKFEEVKCSVTPEEFSDQIALIIGGSRGLGEVTAKIIAAGGGSPIITFFKGKEDALRIQSEIQAQGATCDVITCDVSRLKTTFVLLSKRQLRPTHIYYFASPKIFLKKNALFDPKVYQDFSKYYVEYFMAIYYLYRSYFHDLPFTLFYPSSTALDEKVKDLLEYATAKAAGETLCAHLKKNRY